ncbi:hypothetical protein [Paenibacillus dendritiformis]|uniref:hypothetical protein n=1 Tax=Paenibacillus dendritiformis TaxID=130049 RepID=UPI0018CFD90E|nr:hypothetical protein [Paenibacillus dendritiformis]
MLEPSGAESGRFFYVLRLMQIILAAQKIVLESPFSRYPFGAESPVESVSVAPYAHYPNRAGKQAEWSLPCAIHIIPSAHESKPNPYLPHLTLVNPSAQETESNLHQSRSLLIIIILTAQEIVPSSHLYRLMPSIPIPQVREIKNNWNRRLA